MTKNSSRGSGAVSGRRPPAPDRPLAPDHPPHSPPPAEATGDATPLVLAAEAAVLRSIVDPEQALHAGRTVLSAAESCGDVEATVIALRAMALGARELGDLQAAERHLRRAIATPKAPRERLAQARLSLVTVRTERGHPLQALRIAALAWAYLSPLDRAKLDTQRAVALAHLGRYQEAIASCDRALQALVAAPGTIDDRRFLAGGLLNRGLVHAYRGDWESASRDITACLQIARHAGLDHLVRLASANLPFLAVRRGDLAGAFGHYRAAEDTLFGYPERLATMRADFAGALLAAHLPGEARELLTMAVPDLEASGALVALAEARLKLAQVELLTGDARRALAVAERAELELAAQDREAWLPLVREVTLRARLMLEGPTSRLLVDLADCADELETGSALAAGAGALRLVAAETALALGDHPLARAQLAHLTSHAIPDAPRVPEGTRLITLSSEAQAGHLARVSRIPAPVRRHALALEASLRDDVPGALREVRDGLAEVGSQMDAFDDPALRAHAARAGERLAAFGLSLAVRDGSPAEVFGWAERWRAVAAPAHAGGTADPDQVRAALGSGALVEFVVEDRSLLAVVITGERMVLRRLGDLGPITEALVQLRYALRRSSLGDCGPGGGLVGPTAEELERLLFGPIEAELGDRPMVVVPAGVLHTLPWGALPCLRERPVSVAAGATAWLAARRLGPVPSWPPVVAAAAGPGLAHAGDEVRRVLALHPRGQEVAGRTGPVLDALVTADVLHLAAHGVFHARSPLLSAITLEDGPLMAYDLLGLTRTARLVVLSACDSGMARTPAEGAPLGLAGTFLARGTTCVVAGMVPVRDADALAVMTLFHELLATGCPPASALASAAAKTGVLGFACFGAGDQPVATGLPGSATQLDHDPT